ncbi:MAG: restriction endonuclease subunit S [Chitinophagaceae bacterium]
MSVTAHAAVLERVQKWLGDLPPGWSGARLFQVADAWTSNVDKHTVEGQPQVRLCNYVDVYKNDSIVDSLDFMAASATRDQVKRFRIRVGDTLITKDSETADDIGVPAFVDYEAEDLVCGYHLAIIRPDRRKAAPKFLYWALGSEPIARQWGVTAAGVTRVGIRSTDLSKVTIPLPPLGEQRAIADYLDRETAQIDALVAKQERFIVLLQERRRMVVPSILAKATPVGHQPDKLHRRTRMGNGSTPRSGEDRYWLDGDIPWVNSSVVNNPEVHVPSKLVTQAAVRECHLPMVKPGSLLVALTGEGKTRGAATILRIGSTINQHLAFIEPDERFWVPDYLLWLIRSNYEYLRRISSENGATKGGLTVGDLRALRLPMPDLREQHRLVDELEAATSRIDALIAKTKEHIALAKERRSALITAAVIGQFDVRTARKAS